MIRTKEINHKKTNRLPSFDDCRLKRFVGRSIGKAHPEADEVMRLTGS